MCSGNVVVGLCDLARAIQANLLRASKCESSDVRGGALRFGKAQMPQRGPTNHIRDSLTGG